MNNAYRIVSNSLKAAFIGAALLISGCSLTAPNYQFDEDSPFYTPVDDLGYRDKYPIGVRSVTTSLELPGKSGQERLTPSEIRKISNMVATFLEVKQSQIIVVVPGGSASDARVLGRAKQVGDLIKRRGVAASRMILRVNNDDTGPNGPIIMRYDALVVSVPDCREWDKESSHDSSNTNFSNFGCSLQHNFGLMIDNPRDLIEPRKTTATHDATRSSVVLEAYRAGNTTGAARDDIESAATITAD